MAFLVRLLILLLMTSTATLGQPTTALTCDDASDCNDNQPLNDEELAAKVEAMQETLSTLAGEERKRWRQSHIDVENELRELRAEVDNLKEQTSHTDDQVHVFSSCKEIRDSNILSPSGEYTIRTVSGRTLDKVYCEMGLNVGGYTFLNPKDLATLTNDEVQAMFADKNSFLMRVRRADTTQPYGVLQQLPQYQNVPLKLGLNDNSGYAAPINGGNLEPNFLYFGFIPASMARQRNQQGLRVNGLSIAFNNCDGNPNSYIVLFPNFAERNPSNYAFSTPFPFCNNLFNTLQSNPSGRVMPLDYFMFFETHWGGCGCYAQTDGRSSVVGTLGAAIGFR